MSQNDTYALIERAAEMERRIKAEARTAQRAAPVVEDEDVEDVAVVESEETIVVAEETVTETVAEPVEEAAAEVEAVEVVAEVAAVAEVDPTAVSAEPVAEAEVDAPRVDEDRIIALTRRAEQAELATARLELELTEARATAERLLEDSNIQLAILAVSSAIAAEVAEGDWDSVSSLAGVASMLDYINHRDDVAEGEHDATDCAYCGAYDHLTTPRAKAAFEKAMAPVLTLAARVERDKVAIAKTEGERYGRRMLVLLREGCKTAGDVEAQVADVRARALSEATGRRVISETRGLLTTEQRTELTPEQREHRRLSGYRD